MSLLNDALKDLDQARPEAKTPGPKFPHTSATKASLKKLTLPAVAAFAVLVWLTVEKDILGLMPAAPEPPQPIAISSQWLEVDPATIRPAGDGSANVMEIPEQVQPSAPTGASATAGAASDLPANSKETIARSSAAQAAPVLESVPAEAVASHDAVARLLDRAAKAFQKNQLLIPSDDNAFQWYHSVLILDPGNHQALAGIDQIQQRYLQWAQQATKGAEAEGYLRQARRAGVSATQIAAYRAAIASTETPAPKRRESEAKPVVKFDQDRDLAQRLRAFPLAQYENKAWLRIRSDDSSQWTTMALADAYAGQRNAAQLQKLLAQTRSAEPAVASYVEAQWRIMGGDLAAAVPLLEAHRATLADTQYHLRLLAGVHAAANDYGQALPLYRQLTQLPDFNHNDWLGYAIALDRVGEQSEALQTYRKIVRVRHSDARVHEFVQARISDLSAVDYQ